jgi:hypothetical protein
MRELVRRIVVAEAEADRLGEPTARVTSPTRKCQPAAARSRPYDATILRFLSAACAAVSCSSIDTVTMSNSSPTFHDSGRRLRTNPSSAIGQSIGQW